MRRILAVLLVVCFLLIFLSVYTPNFQIAQSREFTREYTSSNIGLLEEISGEGIDILSNNGFSMVREQTLNFLENDAKGLKTSDVTKHFKNIDSFSKLLSTERANISVKGANWVKVYGGTKVDLSASVQQTADGGFIVSGDTDSFGAGGRDILVIRLDSNGNLVWAKTYGGNRDESTSLISSIKITKDGGFVIGSDTNSFGAGGTDILVIRLDSNGNLVWAKTYGGNRYEQISSIKITKDEGLIIGGDTTSFGAGSYDAFAMRLDSNGNVSWVKTFGGKEFEQFFSVLQIDAEFVFAGVTYSFGVGNFDIFIVKLDSNGNVLWSKTLGGNGGDYAYCIQSTTDSGLVLAGATYSFGAGDSDVLVMKLDSSGNLVWAKTYGGKRGDEVHYILQSKDGDFILAGSTNSFGEGGFDMLIMKLDSSGNLVWSKTFGGSYYDSLSYLELTVDGGFIASGMTFSFGAGNADIIIMKVDTNGSLDGTCNYLKDITSSIIVKSVSVTATSPVPTIMTPSISTSYPDLTITSPNIQTQTVCCSVSPRVYGVPVDFRFNSDLNLGVKGKGPDVRCLQIVLNMDPDTQIATEGAGSPGNESTNFGPATQDAVRRFQKKYGLLENGLVTLMTRTKLNEILDGIFTEEYKSKYNLLDKEERKNAVFSFIKKYKKDYLPVDFPDELILAIVAQETGDYAYWNNEFVADDWGRGLMQITTDEFVGAGGIDTNSEDCLRAKDRTKPKINCSKYYSNTLKGIEANIKDGLYTFKQKYRNMCPGKDKLIESKIFTCKDIEQILAIWGYNGFAINNLTGEYTGNYLKNIADKLENINNYFSNVYSTSDFVQKLRIANDNKRSIKIYSPGDICAIDARSEITGLFNGQVKEEIPNSMYDPPNKAILILFPEDAYTYEVIGKSQGDYTLLLDSTDKGVFSIFKAKDIPIAMKTIHQYTVDWNILSQGGEGVSLNIDSNGDGTFDRSLKSGRELTGTEFSQFTIFSSSGNSGTISPLGPIPVSSGASQTFIITAYPGYGIKDVLVDGVSVGAVCSYTFTNITSNHTIEAIFQKEIATVTIILQIGNQYMSVNGSLQEIDPGRGTKPIIKNSRTLVPIRAIVEVLGGTVEWNDKDKSVTIRLGSTLIKLQIGNAIAYVNSSLVQIDPSNPKVVPEIINSRTMLPLRFVTENLGATVEWDGTTKTITITYSQ